MTESKHTPGPWVWINPETDESRQPGEWRASLRTAEHFGENKTEVIDGKSYTSFSLPKFILEADEIRDENMEANARLVAAAPDLLDALEDLLSAIGTHDPEWAWQERGNARDAIVKATGQ